MSSKLCVGCLIVVILSLIKLAITRSPLKVQQTWGSMVLTAGFKIIMVINCMKKNGSTLPSHITYHFFNIMQL